MATAGSPAGARVPLVCLRSTAGTPAAPITGFPHRTWVASPRAHGHNAPSTREEVTGLDEEIPAELAAACGAACVLAELAGIFRRNAHALDVRDPGPDALARRAVRLLLDPDTSRVADVGGLRLHLAIPGPDYDEQPAIHVSAWDEDGEVWRSVGRIPLAPPAPLNEAGR